ncbi:MAG: glutamine amidotransferase [Lachnospiraceae bacterium]|nr:glutamine amidotransferase [Lachnospiraceae bacterium]
MKKVLIVGESWTVQETHVKGFDSVDLGRLEQTSANVLIQTLEDAGIQVDYLPSHEAQYHFPDTIQELQEYSAIVLSDIGSNTIMMDPVMQFQGIRKPNRFYALVEYVKQGGGLAMFGGYLSFSGIENKARYAMTPLADILPITMLNYDDRMEHPEGICPVITQKDHPVAEGVNGEWPWFLGYNKIKAKEEADEIAVIGEGDTFMAAMDYGLGRTFAFASDCAMHWGSKEFLAWDGYKIVMVNIFKWLAHEI